MATTDNPIDLARRIPSGSYILNKEATDMFPNMKNIASKFTATKSEVLNGQNAMLTDGETYVPPSGVKAMGNGVTAIGVEMLDFMNNKPEEGGGHSAIDRLIQMATLQNIKSMDRGGEVTTDSTSDMQGYENGGFMSPDATSEGMVQCFTSGRVYHYKQIHAGHFMSRKNLATRWCEMNVQPQSPKDNLFGQGEQYLFGLKLDAKYGEGTSIKKQQEALQMIKFARWWYEDKITYYKSLVEKLKKEKDIM